MADRFVLASCGHCTNYPASIPMLFFTRRRSPVRIVLYIVLALALTACVPIGVRVQNMYAAQTGLQRS